MDVLIVPRAYVVFTDREALLVYFFISTLFYAITKTATKNHSEYKYYGLSYKKLCHKKIGMLSRSVGS